MTHMSKRIRETTDKSMNSRNFLTTFKNLGRTVVFKYSRRIRKKVIYTITASEIVNYFNVTYVGHRFSTFDFPQLSFISTY